MAMRPSAVPRAARALLLPALIAGLWLAAARPAAAQLRPLDPGVWQVFDPGRSLSARLGAGFLQDQRASLAGVQGSLRELGNFQVAWRSGRVALEIGGTLARQFQDDSTFAPALDGVDPAAGPRRRDSGVYHVGTVVHLTPLDRPAGLAIRFGTRLPTTDNQVGLDRDQTDFFALLGGQYRRLGARLSAEVGVGIHGTRDMNFEQADVLSYALAAEYRHRWITPVVVLLGQKDGFQGWEMRGNEDLSELRAGLRVGDRYWLQALWVHGLARFSPGSGLLLGAGLTR